MRRPHRPQLRPNPLLAAALLALGLGWAQLHCQAHADGGDDPELVALHVCEPGPDAREIASKSRTIDGANLFSKLPEALPDRTTLDFTMNLVDTFGGWNAAENSYTVPMDGMYRMTFKSELTHDPKLSVCLHVWGRLGRLGDTDEEALVTLYAINSADQAPSNRPYSELLNDNKIAFKPNIETDIYLEAGDVIYPMWIQFYPRGEDSTTYTDRPATLTAPYCENHQFKLHRLP